MSIAFRGIEEWLEKERVLALGFAPFRCSFEEKVGALRWLCSNQWVDGLLRPLEPQKPRTKSLLLLRRRPATSSIAVQRQYQLHHRAEVLRFLKMFEGRILFLFFQQLCAGMAGLPVGRDRNRYVRKDMEYQQKLFSIVPFLVPPAHTANGKTY